MTEEHDFKEKLKQSETAEIKTTIQSILEKEFGKNIKFDWTGKDMKAQLSYSNDVVVIQPDGTKTTIDYKVISNCYEGNCFIETCSQYRKKCDVSGWFCTSPAQYVLYVYRTKYDFNSIMENKYFLLPLTNKKLRQYILEKINDRREITVLQKDADYTTKGYIFTISELQKVVEESNKQGYQCSLNIWGMLL